MNPQESLFAADALPIRGPAPAEALDVPLAERLRPRTLAEVIGQDAQRMAGAVDMEVGEGRANVPVGTIMAMIEQQTQVMGAVHKRNQPP